MSFSNPLRWPPGWPRTNRPVGAPFGASQKLTFTELERAISSLQLSNVVITTNQRLRFDGGLSTARDATPLDPGIAAYFTRNGNEVCIPCDKYTSILGNLRAIGLTLEYMRRMERYGTSQMVDAAFRGFTALPESIQLAGPATARAWHEVLQVAPSAGEEVIRAAYRKLAGMYHPDNPQTGDHTKFLEIQRAYDESGAQ
jgi:hypothetical protein